MIKKLLALLIAVLGLLLAGCGKQSMASSDTNVENAQNESTDSIIETAVETKEETDAPTEASNVNVNWTEFKYNTSDSDGYTYEITYQLSPWILLSNSDVINSAWNEVGNGNKLPSFDDWLLKKDSLNTYTRSGISHGGSTGYFAHKLTDMYYCIGTVMIQNTTEGWNIDSNNIRSIYVNLNWSSGYKKTDYAGSYTIGRAFFGNKTEDECDGLNFGASLKNNSWGPVPFVIMAPENVTPSNPDGEHIDNMKAGFFYANKLDDRVNIDIVR